ncbi:hypothetical protein CIK05_04125 [Bdellovibrio sp. qaytius]|nr:hypothetical protein CIK05_04125 [Bdellovibrio sp. qaytius]
MKQLVWIISLLTLIQFFSEIAGAEESSGGSSRPWLLSRGSAAREAKRFNLYDWLEQKNRNQVMDMWLSLNTPSPYEFMLGINMNQYSLDDHTNPVTKHKAFEGELSAYATLVGLTGEYQNNVEEQFKDTTGMFNLRLFGQTLQGTHLTVHYGLRTRTDSVGVYRLNQQFAAGTLQLYLTKFFGIYGNYRQFVPITESNYGDTKGNISTTGLFIDFASLRIMGSYFKENQNSIKNGVESKFNREGSKIALQLYF